MSSQATVCMCVLFVWMLKIFAATIWICSNISICSTLMCLVCCGSHLGVFFLFYFSLCCRTFWLSISFSCYTLKRITVIWVRSNWKYALTIKATAKVKTICVLVGYFRAMFRNSKSVCLSRSTHAERERDRVANERTRETLRVAANTCTSN